MTMIMMMMALLMQMTKIMMTMTTVMAVVVMMAIMMTVPTRARTACQSVAFFDHMMPALRRQFTINHQPAGC